jgi:hypothetical protein
MPTVNFGEVEDAEDYTPIPDGKYLCHVERVEETTTQYGDDMWKLWLQVDQGPYAGRNIFDNLVFSAAAMKRVKLFCARAGIDVSGEVELTPETILDRRVFVTVQVEEYEDQEGSIKKRNKVPFAGYESAEETAVAGETAAATEGGEDDGETKIPF